MSLNIMWSYLEQGSFPMSEAQLMEKYERTATYLNTWQQANQVRMSTLIWWSYILRFVYS